jgi:hypothetical protein
MYSCQSEPSIRTDELGAGCSTRRNGMTTLDRILVELKEKKWESSGELVFTHQQIEIIREEITKQFSEELKHIVSVPEPE